MRKRVAAGLIALTMGLLTLNAGCSCSKNPHDKSCYEDQAPAAQVVQR